MPYKIGDHYCICDRCGFRRYASEMRKEWNGSFVCLECFDPKHPQYVEPTSRHERQKVDISRPEGEPVFIETKVTPDDL